MTDPLNQLCRGGDIETPCRTTGYLANVGSNLLACRDNRLDDVSSLKTEVNVLPRLMTARKTVLVGSASLPVAMPDALYQQRFRCLYGEGVHFTYTSRIDPVCLGQS